jgi:hypothetical protein
VGVDVVNHPANFGSLPRQRQQTRQTPPVGSVHRVAPERMYSATRCTGCLDARQREDEEHAARRAEDTGLNQPGRVAVDSTGNLYVTDYDNKRMLKLPVQ